MVTAPVSAQRASLQGSIGHVIFDEAFSSGQSQYCRMECEDAKPPAWHVCAHNRPVGGIFRCANY